MGNFKAYNPFTGKLDYSGTSIGDVVSGATEKSVLYIGSGSLLANYAGFIFDTTATPRLQIPGAVIMGATDQTDPAYFYSIYQSGTDGEHEIYENTSAANVANTIKSKAMFYNNAGTPGEVFFTQTVAGCPTITAGSEDGSYDIQIVKDGSMSSAIKWDASTLLATLANGYTLSLEKEIHRAVAASGSPTEGEDWNDSTQKCRTVYQDGVKQYDNKVLYIATADGTSLTDATAAETSIIPTTGVGTRTLPANFFLSGKTLRFHLAGSVHVLDLAGNSILVKIKKGSTILASGTLPWAAPITTLTWQMIIDVVGRSTTTASATALLHIADGSAFSFTGAPTMNTNSEAIDITGDWTTASSAGGHIQITTCNIEVLA